MPDAALLFALAAAPFVGSFLGTLVLRLPEGRPVLLGRSACPYCGTRLAPRDLVPLLSGLLRRGRCRHCGAPLGAFYPAIELAALAVAAWATTETTGATLWLTCGLGWTLLTLALIDARHLLLPEGLTWPLLAAGLAATAWIDPDGWRGHALGAALGWLGFTALARGYRAIRGRDGLGGGDATLLGAGGAWLGAAALPGTVLLASLLALGWVGAAALTGRRWSGTDPIPFGVPLAAAIWLAWLYGAPLLR